MPSCPVKLSALRVRTVPCARPYCENGNVSNLTATEAPTCTKPPSCPTIFASTSSGALVGTKVMNWSPDCSTEPTETLATVKTVASRLARSSTNWWRNRALLSFWRASAMVQLLRLLGHLLRHLAEPVLLIGLTFRLQGLEIAACALRRFHSICETTGRFPQIVCRGQTQER